MPLSTSEENLNTENILVTGGAGYIGSHTCKLLAQSGLRPVAYDNLSVGNRLAVQWGPLVVADIADTARLSETIRQHNIRSVIHFAASAYVGESTKDPRKYYRNNVTNAIGMLDCLLDCGVRDIIFSSTCATYGIPQKLRIDEEHSQLPINPYGESKLSLEKALRWYGLAYGLKWIVLRYFNAAGADLDGELGECHDPETHLIPLAIRASKPSGEPLPIFGVDYPTPDGTAIRDYVHVMDLAQAHLLALHHLHQDRPSSAFNLGTGVGHSVADVIRMVEQVSGLSVNRRELPRRTGDPAQLVADALRARRELGWQPKYSDLKIMVESALSWECRGHYLAAAAAQGGSEKRLRDAVKPIVVNWPNA